MNILVNGASVEMPEGATLAGIIAQLQLDSRGIAIAVNDAVVPRSRHAAHALNANDRVEVIQAVAGG